MFASLYPILTSTEPADQAFLDVVSRIDVPKVLNRFTKAARSGEAFKVVLFQYYYTRKGEVPNLVTRLNPSGMLLQDAFFRFNLVSRLQELFNPGGQYGGNVVVYRRRRTFFESGVARRSPHEFQVVLSVAAGAFPPVAPAQSTLTSESAPAEAAPADTSVYFPAAWHTLSSGSISAFHTVDLSGNPAITVTGVPEGYFVFAEIPEGHSAIDGNGTVLKKINSFSVNDTQIAFNPAFYGLPTMTFSTPDVRHLLIGASCSIADSDARIQYRVEVQTSETSISTTVGFVPETAAPESAAPESASSESVSSELYVPEIVDVDVDAWSPDQAQDGRAYIYQSIGNAKKIARVKTCTPNNPTRNSVPLLDAEEGTAWVFENVGPEPLVLVQGSRTVLVVESGVTGIVGYSGGEWN